MPILASLSRKLHMLTSDAKPDPPRIPINDSSTIQSTSEEESKCMPTPSPVAAKNNTDASLQVEKLPRRGTSMGPGERMKPKCKTKSRPKSEKQSSGVNGIKYNIINSHKVNVGSRTSYIYNINQYAGHRNMTNERLSPTFKMASMPNDVKLLTTCPDAINFQDMFVIKTHIGHGWRDVARQLCYSNGQIEQFEENYQNKGVSEIVYQILLDWKQTNSDEATVGVLGNALWTCHEYDCIRQWIIARNDST